MKEQETERLLLMQQREKELFEAGYTLIAGVDEAGRGPLAGDVYAAAVILPVGCMIEGLNDSKKLSEKKREKLYDIITETAVAWAVATASVEEIDTLNILNATHLAMNRAITQLSVMPDYVLIDGNSIKNVTLPHETMVSGDARSCSIAAASVLAKVARDRYICAMAEKFPNYLFDQHKGYGTKAHIQALLEHGPCPLHRKTFLKKILGES